MLRKLLVVAGVLVVLGFGVFWFLTIPGSVPESALSPHTPNLENGRTVFFAGGCASCHATPGQDDRTRLGGGLALNSPFGTFYAPNISPHPRDGIGAWTEAQFATAMVKGASPHGRHYYPAFPYSFYQRMRMEDVRDLFAYLKTLPAAEGRVRGHDLPFPFNVRRGVGLWNLLYLDGRTFTPDPTKSEQLNRGAYLVEALAHCAGCHSPRNILGGIVAAQRYAGGPNPTAQGWVPNITPRGLKDWSDKDIAYLLETGLTPEGDSVGGNMAAVIRNTSQLTPADRMAIAAYIKSLPPVEGPPRPQKK